jgi:hypothetical protein
MRLVILPAHRGRVRTGQPLQTIQTGDALLCQRNASCRWHPHLQDSDEALGQPDGPMPDTTPSKSIKQSGNTDLLLVIDYFLLAI